MGRNSFSNLLSSKSVVRTTSSPRSSKTVERHDGLAWGWGYGRGRLQGAGAQPSAVGVFHSARNLHPWQAWDDAQTFKSRAETRILVCALSARTYPVVRYRMHWIPVGRRGSLGFAHDGENDRTMALPRLRI
jgi:hypothetical protein